MREIKIKALLDYIPFMILCISAIILIYTVSTTNILLVWKHYLGLALLPIIGFLLYRKHLLGVLATGLVIIAGLIGLISFSPAITTTSFGFGNNKDWSIDIVRFQPIFLLWLVIYIIFSGRLYVGIASKKYWKEVKEGKRKG